MKAKIRSRSKAQRAARQVISLELGPKDKPVIKAMLRAGGKDATVASLIRTGLRWYSKSLSVHQDGAFESAEA